MDAIYWTTTTTTTIITTATHEPAEDIFTQVTSMEKFVGKWQVTGTDNIEQMLNASHLDDEKKKLYKDMQFMLEYKKESDDDWVYIVYLPTGDKKEYHFTISKEFESSTLDGRPIVSCINVKDGKFVELHKDKEDSSLNAEMVREIIDNELVVSATVRGITGITRHKRV